MKRIAEDFLVKWYKKKTRMPLIIRGARQVGKSTLVRLFCQNNNLDLIEINLEIVKFRTLEERELNLENLIDEIQLKFKKKISSQTILFFDEIQESPELLKAFRYFYEQHANIPLIAAGSLLELTLHNEKFSFPVGRVEFYHLGPMTFSEYLWATNNHLLEEKLGRLEFNQHNHDLFLKELVKYYYIGGMPKAIKTYIESQSLFPVREIQNQILQTYIADFPKYNSRINVRRIEKIFFASVLHLGKKLIYQKLDSESQSRDIRRIVELLIDARVLLPCTHTNANSIPLLGESDLSIFKIYFLDIGLANALLNMDFDFIDHEFKSNFNTKGTLAEQFVAQHLAYGDNCTVPPHLFYWLKDKGSQKGEIDFIFSKRNTIIPIEVKSTTTGHLKSLFYFINEKKRNIGIKISLDDYSQSEAGHKINGELVKLKLLHIPQYAVEKIDKILDKFIS
ncbi:MAG: hypothetical protein A2381_20350 [Bdellovibrionales bacterium RIFOXYB1_FULL_37_110]|nr:MAG: hypothetical protein A2181_03985 [Bdellovibrionales bacterium RIFOXYA1_FULL_38_20]OFZ51087.1 MAG: hypothetical protein A2417_20135 [Bdellovibrionales bacterium RIFOXYC1_FULL_37_79]OFZ60299.1 MAG: hypothetical protein A2381_20350 [Bdellovibrionales bacterium RIFOXYB1_FULL_37_110]OFZ60572.1 MAG: hypothetical protein A2328_04800 [Bdellovibrionales bacterium RIFOXYB2_FULL_36_6]OFZ63294.1 MAG: hypothetical protein A2577_01665 [Bdellovibrionales bacterium RIFOXYD1_FULL_36_51]